MAGRLATTIAKAQKAALRPASPATAAANRILSAVTAAGKPPHHPGTMQAWTGAQPQRLWDKTCATLRYLITREDQRPRMLRDHHVALLATLPCNYYKWPRSCFQRLPPHCWPAPPGMIVGTCNDLHVSREVVCICCCRCNACFYFAASHADFVNQLAVLNQKWVGGLATTHRCVPDAI